MKGFRIYLFTLLVVVVYGRPQGPDKEIKIISQTNEISPEGGYEWSYETENGIKAQETGTLKKGKGGPDGEDAVVAQGSYSYTDKEGNQISVVYVADDEGGFQPQGAHLPTPPPIPPNIQKALDWIASQPSTTERAGRRRK
ncbi:endocuticle structural glycoprotein SgAbd-4-like [Coccinella septempunctata]|uniref:endocuticle structural glycoprotein SgAbd-4-like n=1 Tax=Coccinella septempunctata TaxID=41139 RepID=UPI001D07B3D9|nr:endocuticle structural glycoprotein SgAbd-4-like [Coccinella septempunctata]